MERAVNRDKHTVVDGHFRVKIEYWYCSTMREGQCGSTGTLWEAK
jgi:hypothetical protein